METDLVTDILLTRGLGVENQSDNKTIKTQNFSENQNQNLIKQFSYMMYF
jgi:hypothetical protein